MRKRYDAAFKSKVALAAIRERETMAQLSSRYEINRVQIQSWKRHLLDNMAQIFSAKGGKENKSQEGLIDDLYKQIGILKVENEWLKKKTERIT